MVPEMGMEAEKFPLINPSSMKQIKWFERRFDFSADQNIFPAIIERLKGTPIRLQHSLSQIPEPHQTVQLDGEWSILENIGHLADLEPLWQGRLQDILEQKEELRHADLENKQTHAANHNRKSAEELIREFTAIRTSIVEQLETLSEPQIFQSALHTRLKKPMRMMDLFLFVAEHDDHHLARITEIQRKLTNGKEN